MGISWNRHTFAWRVGGMSLLATLFYAGYWNVASRMSLPRPVLIFDARFSKNIAKRYELLLTPQFVHEQAIASLDKRIARELPAYAGLTARYLSKRKVIISLQAKTPLVSINQRFVVAVDGTLCQGWEFNKAVVEQLPQITVSNMAHTVSRLPELAHFVTQLPLEIIEMYEIVWHDKTMIELRERVSQQAAGTLSPPLVLIAYHDTVFTPTMLAQLQSIKQKLQERSASLYKGKKRAFYWRIDLRMTKQLIVTQVQGEG